MTMTDRPSLDLDEQPPELIDGLPEAVPEAGRRTMASRFGAVGWALVGLLALLGLWQLGSTLSPDLPAPAEGLRELRRLASDPFYDNGPNDKGIGLQLLTSLRRVFTGFTLAALVGVPLGLLMGAARRVWQAANPVVQLLRPVSPLAWFPIWLVLTKDPGKAAVYVIFVTALWPTVLNTAAGASAIPRDHRNVAKVFCFGRLAYLRHVLLPNTLPSVITGLRQSMGIAWMVIVAVEMLSSGGSGIGFFVWESYNTNNLSAVIAALLIIGALGLALDAVFLRIGRWVALEEVQP